MTDASDKHHAAYDPGDPSYYDRPKLEAELDRVFDVCHSCRLCFNLCGSFPALFEAVDRQPAEVGGMTRADDDRVVDRCYQCKICFVKCPYTPPHEWQIDFPRLMLRAAATRAKEKDVGLAARLLARPEWLGELGRLAWPVSNVMSSFAPHRLFLEKAVSIHRKKRLPPFAERTFESWFQARDPAPIRDPVARVTLYYTCYVNWNEPSIGEAAVRVLERNGVEVTVPREPLCCGMPLLDQGDVPGFLERARANVQALEADAAAGRTVVALQPTCGYVLKNELPSMLPSPASRKVGAATLDVCELLMKLESQKKLDKSFRTGLGVVSYHLPCHLRAQNVGQKSCDLLRLVPRTRVVLVEQCSAHDGTWAMKRENFDDSMRLGKKCFAEVEDASPEVVASDCPLAAIQIEQGTGRRAYHPVVLLDAAYSGVKLASPVRAGRRYDSPPLPEKADDWRERLKGVKELTAEDVLRHERGEPGP